MKRKVWYKNKNVLILAALVIVIAVVLIVALTHRHTSAPSPDAQMIDLAQDQPQSAANLPEAAAYVVCSLPASSKYGVLPLPAEGSVSYPIRQILPDGTETENILHLTPEGFCMESSSCKNQDCVGQGMVTIDNREDRVLFNSVICLPNQVMAELFTAEEIAEMNLSASDASED